MTDVKEVLLEYICPGIGVILANAVFSAPVCSLQKALKAASLGDINPLPWVFMTGNCMGWVAYSILTSDLFVFAANAPGAILSLWLNFGVIKLEYVKRYRYESVPVLSKGVENIQNEESDEIFSIDSSLERKKKENPNELHELSSQEKMFIIVVTFWVFVFWVVSFCPLNDDEKQIVIGVIVNLNLIVFYAAPLSTIMTVISTKNAASIHTKLMTTCLFNAVFWLAYGFAITDPIIIIPNCLGLIFGIIQVLLWFWFPKTSTEDIVFGFDRDSSTANCDDESGSILNDNMIT